MTYSKGQLARRNGVSPNIFGHLVNVFKQCPKYLQCVSEVARFRFTAQLTEIRRVKYAKIMCGNADSLPQIQPNVLIHPLSAVTNNAK